MALERFQTVNITETRNQQRSLKVQCTAVQNEIRQQSNSTIYIVGAVGEVAIWQVNKFECCSVYIHYSVFR